MSATDSLIEMMHTPAKREPSLLVDVALAVFVTLATIAIVWSLIA